MTRRSGPLTLLATLAAATLGLAACGTQTAEPGGKTTSPSGPGTSASPYDPDAMATNTTAAPTGIGPTGGSAGADGLRLAIATVLQEPGAGAELCLGGVQTSLPPQCGGPVIDNWDWAAAPKHQSAAGVRWGEYAVIGRYDAAASTFHLTEPVTTPEDYDGPLPRDPSGDNGFSTPCPVPEGGWQVLDPAKTTMSTQDATLRAAEALPTYAGAWLDQSMNPASDPALPDAEAEEKMNDPKLLILNIKVTKDAGGAEATLRKTWGGMLCVSEGGRTEADLRRIQEELVDLPEHQGSGVDTKRSQVQLSVVDDADGSVQARMDATYGPGLIRVVSLLIPYPG